MPHLTTPIACSSRTFIRRARRRFPESAGRRSWTKSSRTGIAGLSISRGSIGCIAMSATCIESGDLVLSLGAGNIHEQLALLAADLVIAEKLREIVGEEGEVRLYEPLAKHTTLRVGGPAQFWVEPRDGGALRGDHSLVPAGKSAALCHGPRLESAGARRWHSRSRASIRAAASSIGSKFTGTRSPPASARS